MKSFLVSALEPSANLHLREILLVLKQQGKEFDLLGIYDEALCEEFKLKSRPLYSSHEFSAMGFVEVLPLIFKAKRAIKELVSLAKNSDATSFLCIDSPAFNIPLAKALNKAKARQKKIYYILPQVWAWKKGRIPVIEANFDILASILPFDDKFFSKSTYVGHPLLDEIKSFKQTITQDKNDDEKTIAFLPGSRRGEIARLMPIFRDLSKNFKGKKLLAVPKFNFSKLDIYGDTSEFDLRDDAVLALNEADFAFICSGTATLQAALIGTPFVLAYKAKKLDYLIAKAFVKLKYIGLANIMLDFAKNESLHPEFIQEAVTVKNLYEAYKNYDYKEFFAKVSFLKEYLKSGCAKNLAQILYET
ncbi:lipid A disaccharide synthase [Campylobacter avium LMG 24591]|uniref:Lipid-A-disaccharide synthase n=1 Tax=Campylobacter avium LMG 24591 TaxID=522484 RepID=A0A222MV03_9BACT|nr:lipid-A-disaccharide synthase [Campylobacter avium]ASQ29783.1 lipid A disaccharide synthase [Campylobacter avium LMG 24591]OYD78882.1 lipid A disaccharide synthase [Campylobacter avium]